MTNLVQEFQVEPAASRTTRPEGMRCHGGMLLPVLALLIVACTGVNASPGIFGDGVAHERGEPPLRQEFEQVVTRRWDVPADVAAQYANRIDGALSLNDMVLPTPQFVLLVDRNPVIQAALLYWGSSPNGWMLLGAAPVSTGRPAGYEHFVTPTGLFEHAIRHSDFRAEGTRNDQGIRGYGRAGARVYDFGWVTSTKGWGDRGTSEMRLQMHATDPDVLEPRLGSVQSKGCIRIPASLNEFLDRHAVLDASYEEAATEGTRPWVLRTDRVPTRWAGRWLVVVESGDEQKPAWVRTPPHR